MSESGSKKTVDHFFDCLTDDYAGAIQRCFPRYQEMLWALVDYLPEDFKVGEILELGSGTGNLSMLLAERFPSADIHLVDVSADSIDVCRSRLGGSRFHYHTDDFRELQFGEARFDLVASSIAVHHLTSTEKQSLFGRIFNWLTPGGIFAYADQHAGVTEDVYRRHIGNWQTAAMKAGSSEEEWQMWMQHQRDHDHHDPLPEQLDWLGNAGFHAVDCTWRYLLWTAVQARKASTN